MSRRNVIWLVAIVLVGIVVGVLAGWLWGLVGAVVTLVASEVVERSRRARLRRERGEEPRSAVRDAITVRRRR